MTGATIHRAVERTGCFSAEQAFSQSIGTSEQAPIVDNYSDTMLYIQETHTEIYNTRELNSSA